MNDHYQCASGGVIAAGLHRLPTWLSSAPVGQWSTVTGSALGSSAAAFNWGGSEPGELRGVVDTWGGWAIDYTGKKIYLQGGGHSNYGGNEIYCLDMVTMDWTRSIDPTPMSLATRHIDTNVHSKWNSDGSPVAAHIYWTSHFIKGIVLRTSFFADFGQTLAGRHAFAPNNEGKLHGFNTITGQWDDPTYRAVAPNFSPSDLTSGGLGYYAVSDGMYYYTVLSGVDDGMTRLRRYDPVENVWTGIGPDITAYGMQFLSGAYPGVFYDSLRGEMVWVGERSDTFVRRINLSSGIKSDTPRTGVTYAPDWDSSYAGCDYDSKRDKYYLYSGQEGKDKNLYVCDPANSYVMSIMAGTGTPTPTTPVAGMNSRFKYIPGWDCLLMQPTFVDPIQVLRLS